MQKAKCKIQKSKYTKIQNKKLKMQNKKWPRMEICFRESKEVILYGMKKYCVSEGLVNLNEAIYDYFEWNQWGSMMAFWESTKTYANAQEPTPNLCQNTQPTPNLRQCTKPTLTHKTYAKPTQMHMRFSSIIVTTLCTRLAFHSFSPQSPASALHPENEKDTCLVNDQRRSGSQEGRYIIFD